MNVHGKRQTIASVLLPEAMAEELEVAFAQPTETSFDPWSYASVLGEGAEGTVTARDTFVRPVRSKSAARREASDEEIFDEMTNAIGDAMFGRYLAGSFAEARVLAERLLERVPDDALANLVMEGCREQLGGHAEPVHLGRRSS